MRYAEARYGRPTSVLKGVEVVFKSAGPQMAWLRHGHTRAHTHTRTRTRTRTQTRAHKRTTRDLGKGLSSTRRAEPPDSTADDDEDDIALPPTPELPTQRVGGWGLVETGDGDQRKHAKCLIFGCVIVGY